MKRWVIAGIALGQAARLGVLHAVVDAAKAAVARVREWVQAALEWHRRRLLTDPTYPVALLALGKAAVRLAVPRAALAAALIALLGDLLAGSRPWELDDDPYADPDRGDWDSY